MAHSALVIGLTGNIATGKSTVLHYLAEKGAHVIDADKIAHKTMEPGGPVYQSIIEQFGRGIVDAAGTINRQKLGDIVFSNVAKLGRLEQIVHPAVFEIVRKAIDAVPARVIVLEAVKLLEAGAMVTLCDEVWVVTATPDRQLQRLMEKRGMNEDQARQRMQMQSPQAAKINQADRVIENNSDMKHLLAKLDSIWEELRRIYPGRISSPDSE